METDPTGSACLRNDPADPLTNTLPIGPNQELIWLYWRLRPMSAAYGMPQFFHLDTFDISSINHAFNATIRCHEALRTTFHETDIGVMQVIDTDPCALTAGVVDLRQVATREQTAALADALTTVINKPFDLTREPPIRLTAVRLSGGETVAVALTHHIACDGVSVSVVLEDFHEFYRSALNGTAPSLPPAAPGYSTFVRTQLAQLADESMAEDLAYWRNRLAGVRGSVLPGAEIGRTRIRSNFETSMVNSRLADGLASDITSYARAVRTTPFAVLLCAMQVLLAVATGEQDIAVGTAVTRRSGRYKRTVGMVANMVVARSQVELSNTFEELVREVSLDLMDAIDHQDVPLCRVVADLNDAGLGPRGDIIRTEFTASATPGQSNSDGRLSGVVARTAEDAFEMVVNCHIEPSEIAIDWEFATSIYSTEVAHGYVEAYQASLAELMHRPMTEMNQLGLVEILARVGHHLQDVAVEPSSGGASEPVDGVLSTTERSVAAVWTDVLGVPVTSPSHNFFELGGHSFLASRTMVMIRSRLGTNPPLRLLFDYPELRAFARRATEGK